MLADSDTTVVFWSFFLFSGGRINVLNVTLEDTDIVGFKCLFRSFPGLNEGSFDKKYTWGNGIATQLWMYVLLVVVVVISPNCMVTHHCNTSICNWGFIATTGKMYTHNQLAIPLRQLCSLSKLPLLRSGRLLHKRFTPTISVFFKVTSNTLFLPCEDKETFSIYVYYYCISSPFTIRECLWTSVFFADNTEHRHTMNQRG